MRQSLIKPLPDFRWVSAAVLFAALVLSSCSDPGDPLPGGYFIFVASGSEMYLNEPKHGGSIPELGTDLEEVGNHKQFIFGRSGGDRGATPGYFLLDTSSGSIKAGLTESNWLGLLTTAGIPDPPRLVNPARKRPIRR